MKTLYKWSIADYHQIVETGILEGKSVELLEGEIVAISPESPIHSSRIDTVADYLRRVLQGIAKVREAHPVTLDNSEPEPDIAIVRLEDNNYATRHPCSQDVYWLVEISNRTLAKDLTEKSTVYARNGIREYWVIDLVNNKLHLFTNPRNSQYQTKEELNTGTINPIAFPEIAIDVERLLAI